ncbi:MAG: sodium:proton antiporter [Planctomycetota bacterium]
MVYVLCLLLMMVGLFGALTQKNLIKIILSVAIIEYAVNLFLILVGYRIGGAAPIAERAFAPGFAEGAVDPLPQAMVLTAIVIGLGVLALMVAVAMRLYHTYGTYDITEIRKLRG